DPRSVAVLARGRFEGNASVCIDRVAGATEECFCQAAVGSESHRLRASVDNRLSRVSTHEKPLARLPLELQHVLEVVIHPVVIGVELSYFSLHGEPWRGDCEVASNHQQFRVKTVDT